MNILNTDKTPGVIEPYSQEYEINGTVYTSGQVPVDPASGTMVEGVAAQTKQSCKDMRTILEAADAGFDRVFRTTCFLTNMNNFGMSNEVYARYFVSKPARSCVTVRTLPKGVLCEIEVIAVK